MKGNIFIKRPVLATSISIIIVILGLIALKALPIEQYPNIAPPTIMVSASYPGASAEAIQKSVIAPLEEQINGVENMTYMVSSATNNGTASITIYFEQGSDADMAQVNVQNRVSQASGLLPSEVTQLGVTTTKQQSSMLYIGALYSSDDKYDEKFLANYAKINILPALQRINGVGNVEMVNANYAMRIWLKPDVMAQYGLEPADINNALNEQNLEASIGSLGENSDNSFIYVMKYKGRLKQDAEYGNIVIKSLPDGNVLHLKDVADIELGSQTYNVKCSVNKHPGVIFMVFQTSGSNATKIITNVESQLKEMGNSLPDGCKFDSIRNTNDFLFASIREVVKTLLLAILLVIVVVYFFLHDLKSTLIPAVSIVVSLLGTFACISIAGFSLNLLTLFSLVLAIGTVVDDAIVVVEAVHTKFDEGYTSPYLATKDAMSDVTAAIITCTLVFMAVFIPVTFTGGTSSVFYIQFGVTLAAAVGISCLNALTLSPALCALLLRPSGTNVEKKNINYYVKTAYNTAFGATMNKYQKGLKFFFHHKWMIYISIIASLACFCVLYTTTKTGLVPEEDSGTLFVELSAAPGSNLSETALVTQQAEDIASKYPEVKSVVKLTGYGMTAGEGANLGSLMIKLKDWSDRKGTKHSATAVQNRLTNDLSKIKSANCIVMAPGMIPGFGMGNAVELYLQDKTGGDMTAFYNQSQNFLAKLSQRPEVMGAYTSFNINYPQYEVSVDAAKCTRVGISPKEVLSALSGYCGGTYASTFNRFSKVYRVVVQANPKYRLDVKSLDNMYVRNGDEMAPLSEFITIKRVYGPESLSRFNLFNSIPCNVMTNNGYSSGQTLKAIQEVAAETLPAGYGYEYSGMSREESKNTNAIFIWCICIIFIYLILASLYESFFVPFAVILTIPFGLFGSMAFTKLFGLENNIYLQVGMVMLIGLLAKTAILLTEYAAQRRKAGMGIKEAALSAAKVRLRPILMTVLTMVVGLLPLVVATGTGANSERSLGTGAVGGLVVGIIALVFVVPVLFVVFQKMQERFGHNDGEEKTERRLQ